VTDPDDHRLARELATEAGHLLLEVRRELAGTAPRALGDAGDRRAHVLITEALARHRPHDAVLSEEAVDDRARLAADRVWIVDPLDGTREYRQPGRTDWAVHVALWQDGDLVAGAVALPAYGVTLATPHVPAPPPADRAPRVIASRSRPPAIARTVTERLGGRLVGMGSAGAKAMAVVQGNADVYVHTGGQYEWDSAAPVAVARAAGLHTSHVDGRPLRYNQSDLWVPDLLICRPEHAEAVLAVTAA
jgi:3'(2'), 5'-bisphosphate nucleotidase